MMAIIDRIMKFMEELFCTDKNLIVLVLFVIAMYALFLMKIEAKEIINNIVSGLLGMAVGMKLSGGSK